MRRASVRLVAHLAVSAALLASPWRAVLPFLPGLGALLAALSGSPLVAGAAIVYDTLALSTVEFRTPFTSLTSSSWSLTGWLKPFAWYTACYAITIAIALAYLIKRWRGRGVLDIVLRNIASATQEEVYKRFLCGNYWSAAASLFTASLYYYLAPLAHLQLAPANTLYVASGAAVLPLAILVAPYLPAAGPMGVALLYTVIPASLKYPPLLLSLYGALPLETLEDYVFLAERPWGVEVGAALAALKRSPTIEYRLAGVRPREVGWSRVYMEPVYRITIDVHSNPHVGVYGSTGAGKSYIAAAIARRAAEALNIPVLILDPHGEYAELVEGAHVINALKEAPNPLGLYGRSPRQRASEVAHLIADIYNLGPLQTAVLEEAILLAYEAAGILNEKEETWSHTPPSLDDVASVLNAMSIREARAKVLASYVSALIPPTKPRPLQLEGLLEGARVVVVDMSGLGDRALQRLYADTVLRIIYTWLKARGRAQRLRLMLLVDEAHIVAKRGSKAPTLSYMAAEMRKYGLSIMVATQRADELDKGVLANVGTKIVLRHDEPKSARYMAEALAAVESDEEALVIETLMALPKGYAVVRDPFIPSTLLVKLTAQR